MAQTGNAAPANIPTLSSTDSAQDAESPPNVPDTVDSRESEAVDVDHINGDSTISRFAVTKERSRKSKSTKHSGPSEPTEEIAAADSAATKEIPPVIPDSGLVEFATTRTHPKTKSATKKGHKLKDGQCPVCRAVPLHLRFQCPVVKGGVRSIEAWLQESQEGSHDESLIREMRVHLEKAKRKVSKADERTPDNNNRSASQVPRTANLAALQLSSALNQSFARELSPEIPFPSAHSLVPAGSEFSEVVVEDQGEGSESDDDTDEDLPIGAGASSGSSFPLPVTFDEASVEALLRGPTHSRSVLAEIASDSSTEGEFEVEELASVEEERNDRAFRRLTKRFERFVPSSDDEPEPDADEAEAPVLLDVHHQGTDDQQEQLPGSHVANEGTQPNADVLSIPEVDETVEQRHSDTPQQHIRQHQDNDIDASTPVSAPVPVRSKRPIESAEEVIPSSDPVEVDQDIAMDESMQDNSSTIGLAGENTVFATSPIVEPMILPPPDALSSIQDVSVSDAQVTSTVEPHSPKLQSGDHSEDQLEDQPSDRALRSPEDPADPIESADDFVAPVPEPSQVEQDPIEPELTQRTVREERSTPPPLATPRPGTAKRMKDRNGKVPRPDELPVLASEILHAVQKAKAASVESDLGAQVELLDDPNSTSASLLEPDTELERPLRRSVRRGASEASSQTPSLLDPVTGRKRRQTMTAEEKAQKAAEKLADKERKAALKKAEKEEKVRRKAEDKARMEAEKKAQKALKGVDKTARGKKGGASLDGTALPVTTLLEPPTSFEPAAPPATVESEVPPVTPAATSATLLTSQNGQVSQVHWTILNQTPDVIEGDSMIDELHSSSPVPSPNHDNAQVNGASQESSRADDSFFTPTGKTNGISPAASTPLFLPSSQYPDTQPALQVLASQVSPSRSDRSVPASEPESDHDDAVFKKPSQPASVAHHWTSNARFRRLSDIASQQLFAPTPVSSTPLTFQTEEDRRKSMYGDMGDIDSSDDSDTDSEDEGNKSHIPKARRAGVQKRKSIT
ncbi:hypothetical protein PHLCEN_2v6953 [Hermanssonia centrifuga]|uniref:Uncharacterized protein n=1 Tax=Hermanssonia centrifuga TaxID=98765 RepID=A0A2R6NYN4_9APHY|nr:hypothetical protein PHLCEN_2v6953 [Hermanssonia centrifuga]